MIAGLEIHSDSQLKTFGNFRPENSRVCFTGIRKNSASDGMYVDSENKGYRDP